MGARADILANIRRSLGVTGAEAPRRAAVEERLERAPRGVAVARGQLDAAGRLALFVAQAQGVQASIAIVLSPADVPAEAARYLRDANLPATLRMGADARLAAMPWQRTALELSAGRSEGADLNAISHTFAAVAETGTLIMVSGADNPTSLNFLPDNHIVVINAKDIGSDYEGVWSRLRLAYGKGELPRTVNMITGPSRSGDIEQTILLGAHGPRALHIIVVEADQG